jgi:hypothetical protein
MTCTVESRQRAAGCARALEDIPTVVCADVFAPQNSTEHRWTVEVLVDADGIPAGVTREVALAGLELRAVDPYNGLFRLVATV